MPETHHGRDSETEQVLEQLIFLYKTGQKQSSQTFQKHRFKMVCETSARHSAQYFKQEGEKTVSITRKTSSNLQRNEAFEFKNWAQNQLHKIHVKRKQFKRLPKQFSDSNARDRTL